MTRNEEIQIAAEEYATGSQNATLRHKTFTDGAKYAVGYPNWHSVEENPIKQDAYLVRVEVDVYGITPPRKFTKYELAPYAECEGIMKWHTLGFTYPNSRITHWMEIPAVELNIEHPAKKQTVTIDAWVARNKCVDNYSNTNLVLGKERPTLYNGTWCSMEEYFPLPQDAFPNITFENSPKKVKVTIKLEEEQ